MTAWIILGCILLFFLFLLCLKVTITIGYADAVTLSVKVLCFRFHILPKKQKRAPRSMSAKKAARIRRKLNKKARKKALAAKEKQAKKEEKKRLSQDKPPKTLAEILDILSLVRSLVATVVRKFFKHLRVDVARLKIRLALSDAASTALAYGAVTGSVNLLLPTLEKLPNFRLPDAEDFGVEADFLGEDTEIDLLLSFSLRVFHVVDIAFSAVGTLIRHLLRKQWDKQND